MISFPPLCVRFEMGPPFGLNQSQFTLFMEKKIKPTRLRFVTPSSRIGRDQQLCLPLCPLSRVFNVFKAWIENHFEDWADNSELISEFRKFVEKKLALEMKSAAQQLMKLLRDKVRYLLPFLDFFFFFFFFEISIFFPGQLDGLKRQSTLTYGENVEVPRPILPKQCKGSADLHNFLKNESNRNWILVDPTVFSLPPSTLFPSFRSTHPRCL